MRLPGRLAAAIEVLAEMERRKRPASEALKSWALDHRFAGAGDRAAIGNLTYDVLRRRAVHAFLMQRDDARALVLSVAVRDWGENPAALNQNFSSDRFAPESLSEEELANLSKDSENALAEAPPHVRANVPAWLESSLEEAFGAQWVEEGAAMAGRPPLDLRVNTLKSSRERVEKSLARHAPERCRLAPDGLRLVAGPRDARTANVIADEGYRKGWFEVQDEGSQLVARLAGAQTGEQVLDYCAGAGGKTLALAAAMDNSGQIFAFDTDRNRLAPIHERLKRNGVRNTQVRNPDPGALKDLDGRMDRVLVDAPCTGSGTWRRRPDTKWKLTAEQLAARVAEQRTVLDAAAGYVRPGGTLVYVTCSVLPEENGRQIADFLARHPRFRAEDMDVAWRAALPLAGGAPLDKSGLGLLLSPARTGTDGFFLARLVRTD